MRPTDAPTLLIDLNCPRCELSISHAQVTPRACKPKQRLPVISWCVRSDRSRYRLLPLPVGVLSELRKAAGASRIARAAARKGRSADASWRDVDADGDCRSGCGGHGGGGGGGGGGRRCDGGDGGGGVGDADVH
eukprot:4920790-Pleurochrysis_carterae.AAC.1